MKKLFELLGLDKPIKGDFGIEIEAEGKGLKVADGGKYWRSEDDGSLRGRFPDSRHEWVFKQPIAKTDIRKAVQELVEIQKDAKVYFSFRTSTHVHVNVQELTYDQILSMVYIYLLFEEKLVDFCGEGRKANRFCLRMQDAEAYVDLLAQLFRKGGVGLIRIPKDTYRYAAMNLEALSKYGSIEFRSMRGTLDEGVIVPWTEMLHGIRKYALSVKNVIEVEEDMLKLGPNDFAKKVFGVKNSKLLGGDFEGSVSASYSLTLELPYAYKAWEKAPKKEEEEAEAPKRIWAKAPPIPQAPVAAPARPPRQIPRAFYAFDYPEIEAGDDFKTWKDKITKLQNARLMVAIRQAPDFAVRWDPGEAIRGREANLIVHDDVVDFNMAV